MSETQHMILSASPHAMERLKPFLSILERNDGVTVVSIDDEQLELITRALIRSRCNHESYGGSA